MSTLCIFNPEHDLALANGSKYFMPPKSAKQFSEQCHSIMNILHNGVTSSISTIHLHDAEKTDKIVAWGWDAMLKQSLLHAGFSREIMPSDDWIGLIRKMQNRTAISELLTHSHISTDDTEIEKLLTQYNKMVLKAPWSGSGRGIRLLTHSINGKQRDWINKVIAEQGAVIAEEFRQISLEFALEYDNKTFVGYSLFNAVNCVYHANHLLYDDEIEKLIGEYTAQLAPTKDKIETWLKENLFPQYSGPLGFDLYIDHNHNLYISEMNLRYTLGHIAHAYLLQHPECHGKSLSIDKMKGIVIA